MNYKVLTWVGWAVWAISLLALPLLKINIPSYLLAFPLVTLLILLIAYASKSMSIKRYSQYAVLGLLITYLVLTIAVIKLWLYLIVGLILFGLFILVFQWLMGHEWKQNPFYWLILIILLAIIVAIGGAIVGPILIMTAIIVTIQNRGTM